MRHLWLKHLCFVHLNIMNITHHFWSLFGCSVGCSSEWICLHALLLLYNAFFSEPEAYINLWKHSDIRL